MLEKAKLSHQLIYPFHNATNFGSLLEFKTLSSSTIEGSDWKMISQSSSDLFLYSVTHFLNINPVCFTKLHEQCESDHSSFFFSNGAHML